MVRSSAEEIVSLYERHAVAWVQARDASQFLEAEWMKRFVELLPRESTILDIGCGSGRPLAEHFINQGFDVVGIDSSPTLIKICRACFPRQNWFIADMRSLALERRFQGLIAWDSFFHLSHAAQRAMFPIFQKHATAGAALMFNSGPNQGEALGTFEGEPLYHGSLALGEYRDLLNMHGFEVVSHEVEDTTCGGRTVWLARAVGRGVEDGAGAA